MTMHRLIERMFRDAPKMTDASGNPDPSQAPAVQCHVLLRGSLQPHFGVLSRDQEVGGMMKMLIPSTVQDDPKKPPRSVLMELFFDSDDIQAIMVEREVKAAERSSLIIA